MNIAYNAEPTTANARVSVVIGFKDRGLGRLELCIESIHESLSEIDHEVIIADYGSADSDAISALADKVSAHHEIIETDGEWSAARARNAGVGASRGDIILAADADMIFTPRSLRRVVQQLDRHPQEVVILQCRDLPVGYSDEVVRQQGLDWDRFSAIGQLRPRWGVGGLVGLHRSVWERLRGWDERMHTYGGEDTDFAKRVKRIGARIDWLDEPEVAMFHMWHPSASFTAARDAATKSAVDANRAIHVSDTTFARNRVEHRYLPSGMTPLVSVLIVQGATPDADPSDALASVLTQTVKDFEVLLPQSLERSDLGDPRIRLMGAGEDGPRGTFTIAITPEELWSEDRLEELLANWSHGVGLISDRTAVRITDEQGKELKGLHNQKPATLTSQGTLLRTALIPADLDFAGPWATAIAAVAATGAKWVTLPWSRHVVTVTPQVEERVAHAWAHESRLFEGALARAGLEPPTLHEQVRLPSSPLLTAVLNEQPVTVEIGAPNTIELEQWLSQRKSRGAWDWEIVGTIEGSPLWQRATFITSDLLEVAMVYSELSQLGAEVKITSAQATGHSGSRLDPSMMTLIDHAERVYGTGRLPSYWLVKSSGPDGINPHNESMRSLAAVNLAVGRTVRTPAGSRSFVMAHVRATTLSAALRISAGAGVPEGTVLVEHLPASPTEEENS